MKKIAVFVAILALVTPAMAAVTITTSTDSANCSVTIGYVATSPDASLSGFALDCNVSDGNTIDDVCDFHIGESNSTAKGFGIFPGSIDINSTTGVVDDYGDPVAPNDDPGALDGIGSSGVTIELGALYEDGNAPGSSGTLCTLVVSGGCKMQIALNTTRGGIVRADSNDASSTNLPITVAVPCVSLCTVPNILGMTRTDANTAIVNAGLEVGVIDYNTSDIVDVNLVMAQDPCGGTQVSCNPSQVSYTLSSGCFTRGASGYGQWISVGKPNCWCYPRHCYGDVDNNKDGTAKQGYYYVGGADLTLLFDNWQVLEPPKGSGIIVLGEPNICADVDHAQAGTAKQGYYRAGGGDLTVMFNNWQVLEPPKGSGIPPDCP